MSTLDGIIMIEQRGCLYMKQIWHASTAGLKLGALMASSKFGLLKPNPMPGTSRAPATHSNTDENKIPNQIGYLCMHDEAPRKARKIQGPLLNSTDDKDTKILHLGKAPTLPHA